MGKAKCWMLNVILTGAEGVCLQKLPMASEACRDCELRHEEEEEMPGMFLFCFLMQTWLRRNLCVQCICRVEAGRREIRRKYLQNFLQVCGCHQGQLVPCFKETNHIMETAITYTQRDQLWKKKRHFSVSSAFCCLLGPVTWTIFRVLKSGFCLEAKQEVQDWWIGLCHDKVCCTGPRGFFLTAPQPGSHMDTHAHSYVFLFRGPWNTREIFHLPREWVTGETEFCPWDRGESMITGNFLYRAQGLWYPFPVNCELG